MTAKRFNVFEVLIFVLLIVKIGLQYLIIHPEYELHRDEFLHLDQANHLDWGFVSVPPFTSWIAFIIKHLGNGVFWVHFFPGLFGSITIFICIKIVRELGGDYYAQLLITVSLVFSVLLRINMLFQPNTVDVLSWTLVYYYVIRFIRRKEKISLFYLAIAIGLGFLNKYNIVFLLAGLLLALPFSAQRQLFRSKDFYVAILISTLIIFPNLYWQYSHGWPVFTHMNELANSQLVNVNRTDFLKDQLLFFFNSIFLLLLSFIGFLFYNPFKYYRLIFLSFLVVNLIFIVLKAKSYYAIGLYPAMLSFGCVYFEKLLVNGRSKKLRFIFPVLIVALFIPFMNIAFPIKSSDEIAKNSEQFERFGLLRWEDGRDHTLPQDFADMIGWKEMARKTEAAFRKIPVNERSRALIITDNYGQAGAINYYGKEFLPTAVSFSTDYINWFPVIKDQLHFIVVGEKSDQQDINAFKSFTVMDSITTSYARERGTGIYLLSYPNEAILQKLRERLMSRKQY